ncbi:MAG: molybdate ABC transporter substrate-binding protein [Oscillospiraceae bacterium]|nr:molybdate ABC transporter substrate-binding protein [Oscillospiraceae bacterium]
MRRLRNLMLCAALLAALVGCGARQADAPTELVVFAAASLQESLSAIGEQYKTVAPDVTLTFSFDSSGTLKTQIEQGADCDLFLSASPKQMNALREDGLIDEAHCVELLENKVALVVADGNRANVSSFDGLAAALPAGEVLLALGNGDVPVGQYAQEILAWYALDEAALADAGALTYASNVKEVTAQVIAGAADCGVVYATDAFSADLPVIDVAREGMCSRVIYPAAVLRGSAHADAACEFLTYLQGTEAAAAFQSVGFAVVAD